ncbi:DUF2963 domain-containing protein [Candidatus Phytoplasma solani]|uniref:DUF2963 domain-containing protein n=1 Tax=Candidatus Phytoplasma solani TaxID=69896 RepID=A0A421NVA7_9MOLU|nr:hypothetical protein [Candidatus Phytoplasma solani]RMI87854.1 hypothetical protein PSSA1_v1c4750 [Candidatus Phytoplasma solani]
MKLIRYKLLLFIITCFVLVIAIIYAGFYFYEYHQKQEDFLKGLQGERGDKGEIGDKGPIGPTGGTTLIADKKITRKAWHKPNNTIDYWSIYEYNSQNQIKAKYGKGVYQIYEYNTQGQLIKNTFYNSKDGSINRYYIYEYNNQRTKKTCYKPDGSICFWSIYEYNPQGHLTKKISYNSDFNIVYCYDLYKCNNQGQKIEKKYVYGADASASPFGSWRYEYNAQGQLTKKIDFGTYGFNGGISDVCYTCEYSN